MTQAQALTAISLLIPGSYDVAEDVVKAVTAALAEAARVRGLVDAAAQGLERAAADMDAASVALLQRRSRANSNQAFADMTDVAGRLTSNAAGARNVRAGL